MPGRVAVEERSDFLCDGRSVADARRWISGLLEHWDHAELVHTAMLLLSEAVTNSFRHAHSAVGVVAKRLDGRIRIEVWDSGASRAEPRLRHPSADDESGRGLQIVDALASTWGVVSGRRGRGVFFELTF